MFDRSILSCNKCDHSCAAVWSFSVATFGLTPPKQNALSLIGDRVEGSRVTVSRNRHTQEIPLMKFTDAKEL